MFQWFKESREDRKRKEDEERKQKDTNDLMEKYQIYKNE